MSKDAIGKISDVRMSNNRLWMKVLEIALMYAPDETKPVLRQINDNDRKIGGLLDRIVK